MPMIDARPLWDALSRLCATSTPDDVAVWTFTPTALVITWDDGTETIAGAFTPGHARVSASDMAGLATILPTHGPIALGLEGDRLRLGSFSLQVGAAALPDPEVARRRAVAWCAGLSEARVERASDALAGLSARRDATYRVFHQSWKMYGRHQDNVQACVRALCALIGEDDASVSALREAGLHPWFVDLVDAALALRPAKNDAELRWEQDFRTLAAAQSVAEEVARASVDAAARIRGRTTGALWSDDFFLDDTDALFLEVWEPLGTAWRYRLTPEALAEARAAVPTE